jgi:hypothetical protein
MRNRLPGSGRRKWYTQNGPKEATNCKKLEGPYKPQRNTKIPGFHRLLPILHTELLLNSTTPPRPNQESDTKELGETPTRSL